MKKAKILSLKCLICNNNFETPDTTRGRLKRTCSKSCASKLAYKKQQIIKPCCRCNKETLTSQSVINGNLPIYCNNCKNLRYEKVCVICNKKFFASHNDTFLCSTDCKTKYNQNNKINIFCDYCGKQYEQAKFNIYDGKAHYCSTKCNQNAYASKHRFRYGKTWYKWVKQIKERDNYSCLACGCNDNLEVHHFIKLTNFNEPDDAHFDNNLGTFCHNCHILIENLNFKSLKDFNERYSPNS